CDATWKSGRGLPGAPEPLTPMSVRTVCFGRGSAKSSEARTFFARVAQKIVGPFSGLARRELGDLVPREPARCLDRDGRRAAGTDLDRADFQDAIGVHREADLDLRAAAWRAGQIAQHEPAEPP